MNTISHTLSNLLAAAMGVALWVLAGITTFVFAMVLMLGLAIAGLWAMLTGRKAWWTQLRQMRSAAQSTRNMWRGGQAQAQAQTNAQANTQTEPQTHADSNEHVPTASPSGNRTPLAQRRFGRAGKLGVTDVQPRQAH